MRLVSGKSFISWSATITEIDEMALIRNTPPGVTSGISRPPIAGPTNPAPLKATALIETALVNCERGTRSGTIEWRIGESNASTTAPRNEAAIKTWTVTRPLNARNATVELTTMNPTWVRRSAVTFGRRSATIPPNGGRTNIGIANEIAISPR